MTREAQIRQTACDWLRYYHPTCTQDMFVEAFRCGAEWADSHNPEIAYLEHEIERLKSKLQAADDLNTLLTMELEKKTPKGDEE